MVDELFTTKMKKATRKGHAVSDALVNAKLLFALNDDRIWAEGLLIFYEIFKFLEEAMKDKKHVNLRKLAVPGMNRTSAFEADLNHYLGPDWKKGYAPRDKVKNYVNHLKYLSTTNSDLLLAYVYHLYMGLLSGGQILRKKRQLQSKILKSGAENQGEAVTYFENREIGELKNELRNRMNSVAETLDENTKALLIEESIKVFELNNSIIRTVQGTEKIVFKNAFMLFSLIALVIVIVGVFFRILFDFLFLRFNKNIEQPILS